MVFSSLTFLFFLLPLSLFFHYITNNNTIRNLTLTIFSLIFYAWGEPMWVFLLLFSSFFDYGNGLLVEKFRGTTKAKMVLALSIIGNVGILISFKYGAFIWENLAVFIGEKYMPFAKPEVTLPIGISFYTFQTVSYIIDVYRGDVKAQRNPLNFLLFVSLFHQLVAGPIVRYQTIAEQIDNRIFSWKDFSDGINRFCYGLFKKVVIANIAGELVEKYLVTGFDQLSGLDAWFGIAMFSIQIYFDFSGYSDMAIGLGKLFGFHYLENFRHPYASQSVGEFYRRWHISLGTFFRDYVYIPLGGNRKNQDFNILVVWFLTGLWHGASWNFVLWGCYFGVLMIIEKYAKSFLQKMPRFFRHLYTLILIVFSRAIFYFVVFNDLYNFVRFHLFDFSTVSRLNLGQDLYTHAFWLILAIILCIPWDEMAWNNSKFYKGVQRLYHNGAFAINLVLLALCTVLLVGSTYNPFLYFRF